MTSVRRIQESISAIAISIALIHIFYPTLAIDSITLTLIIIAFIPWLAPLLKSLQLPGGVDIEFRDLEKIGERAKESGLIYPETKIAKKSTEPQYSFQLVADEDPNLALAGLRIELERIIKKIAKLHNVSIERASLSKLLFDLADRKILSNNERAILSDLTAVLNQAVHGVEVNKNAVYWAMDVGLSILRSLDERTKSDQ